MSSTESILKDVVDDLDEGVYFVDKERKITYWNRGATKLTGHSSKEVVGTHCCDNLLVHVDKEANGLCKADCPLVRVLGDGIERESDIYLRHKDGHRVLASVKVKPIRDESGEIVGAVEIFKEQPYQEAVRNKMAELEELVLLDPITRLANRRHTEETLQIRLEEMYRYGWQFGVLFIDIDHFKKINDTHGHDAGDKVLNLSAKTMQNSLRPFDFLGRWGGEEFVAIVVNVDDKKLFQVADRMRKLVEKSSFVIEDEKLNVTVSIGATMVHRGDTLGDLVRRADKLMYESKVSGRNRVSSAPTPAPSMA